MFKRPYLIIAISLIVVIVLSTFGWDARNEGGGEPTGPATSTLHIVGETTAVGAQPQATQNLPVSILEVLATVEIVKIVAPSVVQIVTETLNMGMLSQPGPSTGVGTGVILDVRSHILTNNHVIAGAERITVTLSNGESFPAEVFGGDSDTEIAVIRIEASGLQPAKIGRSSRLQVGEEVIAIGHALGLPGGPTVSKGVVSALGRSIATGPQTTIVDLIQTDAPINLVNSGGPLVNSKAEVIGINTAIIRGSQGIGFAVNMDYAQTGTAQLMQRGYVNRGF